MSTTKPCPGCGYNTPHLRFLEPGRVILYKCKWCGWVTEDAEADNLPSSRTVASDHGGLSIGFEGDEGDFLDGPQDGGMY